MHAEAKVTTMTTLASCAANLETCIATPKNKSRVMYHFPCSFHHGDRCPLKPAYWDDATRALGRADPVMRRLIRGIAGVHLTRRGDAFTTLSRAIVGQQISVKAAQTIWNRYAEACGAGSDPGALGVRLDPGRVARMRLPKLRTC